MSSGAGPTGPFEYVVVGSGAGGGTLAARLAESGCRVLVLEAGGDPLAVQGDAPLGKARMPEDYHVPVFHASSTENTAMSWEFFVRHYESDERQRRDPKFVADQQGVFYPRAGTLGGCTAHNAMIMVYPHNEDWDHIAYQTGDPTWKAEHMRRYFQRLEDCRHRAWPYRWLARLGFNWTRHGWHGWLSIEKSVPKSALHDRNLVRMLTRSAKVALKRVGQPLRRVWWALVSQLDPNDWRVVKDAGVGLHYAPLTTRDHARTSTRDRLRDVERRFPGNLTLELDALATEVILDDRQRAVGVRYLKGARLYQAHPGHSEAPGEAREVRVTREVILAGGAFNTPQLLMLSGIGPREELERHGIATRVDLPGVGANLQDRYEVGLVHRMNFPSWKVLEGSLFAKGDPQFREWEASRKGVYATNGAVLAVIKRADPGRLLPDLFCFAVLGKFPGYFPGYSALLRQRNYLTWAILKAHTNNTAGRVTLRSKDPRERPAINFRYFDEGNDENNADVDAVVDGIRFVRSMTEQMADLIAEEELPGRDKQTQDELRAFVKDHAWGHHASCTCPIGPPDHGGVLNSAFEVHGTQNLRVVDASVFPRIPGFFIVSAVYMIGEKAADVILAKAGKPLPVGEGLAAGEGLAFRGIRKPLNVGLSAAIPLLALAVAALLAAVGIAVASWFYFEPHSAPRDTAEEQRVIQETIAVLTDNFLHQYEPRFFRRDTHPKANACLRATFAIDPSVAADPRLNVGVFRGRPDGKPYKAWLRLSNAANEVTEDKVKDFRGLGLKLVGVEGEKFPVPSTAAAPEERLTQDFMFVAHDAFFAGNVQHFHDFFAACRAAGYSCAPLSVPLIWHALTHPRGINNARVGRKAYRAVQEIRWFSVAPFELGGPDTIVKYGLFPQPGETIPWPDIGASKDYLTERLRETLDPARGKGIALDFAVQFRSRPERQPIESTLIGWDAADSPWHKVATVDIFPQTFDAPGQWEFCQNIAFNPWHSRLEHKPVGGINRARRDVMHALQTVRREQNGRTHIEPTGDETF